jgi:hypothetical protein
MTADGKGTVIRFFEPWLRNLSPANRFRLELPSENAEADRKWFTANPCRRTYVRCATFEEVAKRPTSGRWIVAVRLKPSRRRTVQHYFCVSDARLVSVTDEIGASVVFEILEGTGDNKMHRRIAMHMWNLLNDLRVEGTA